MHDVFLCFISNFVAGLTNCKNGGRQHRWEERTQKTSCVGMYLAVYCGTFHIYWIVWDTG